MWEIGSSVFLDDLDLNFYQKHTSLKGSNFNFVKISEFICLMFMLLKESIFNILINIMLEFYNAFPILIKFVLPT